MPETPNMNYINELSAGSEEFKQKIITIMKKEFPEEKKEFLTNYNNQVFLKTAENVHKLKHKIGMLGLENGYRVAIDFEDELKQHNSQLFQEFMLILNSIENFLKTI
ncbi:Hpt domain-containing protein [uncultured Aquimarina sp.]|uniref:Hpt domain-containing protein n=1 Tax=uncultured Aquimarina sp. TaxID=575652 RepID=UPI0026204D73|nr:Hpt domain-containing protein [uncultured Aquimarina sp.]